MGSSEVKFVSSRAREPSLEDLTQMSNKKRNEVKRSSSNHGTRPSGFDSSHVHGDTTTAQLIADSTEKKFNFNPFKGKKLFKKKQYSFDFNWLFFFKKCFLIIVLTKIHTEFYSK